MNTLTSINWTRTVDSNGTKIHTGTRAGWTFVIHTTNKGKVDLVGSHKDGRRYSDSPATTAQAKEAVYGAMHPSEAMGWSRDLRTGDYSAQWGAETFHISRDGQDFWTFRASGSNEGVRISGFLDGRALAHARLEEVYGPVGPVTRWTSDDRAVTALEAALRAAGIRFTAKQLAVAALSLSAATSD